MDFKELVVLWQKINFPSFFAFSQNSPSIFYSAIHKKGYVLGKKRIVLQSGHSQNYLRPKKGAIETEPKVKAVPDNFFARMGSAPNQPAKLLTLFSLLHRPHLVQPSLMRLICSHTSLIDQ